MMRKSELTPNDLEMDETSEEYIRLVRKDSVMIKICPYGPHLVSMHSKLMHVDGFRRRLDCQTQVEVLLRAYCEKIQVEFEHVTFWCHDCCSPDWTFRISGDTLPCQLDMEYENDDNMICAAWEDDVTAQMGL